MILIDITKNPVDLIHQVLKSKYFPDSAFWRANPSLPKSAFWASILKVKPMLEAHSFYQITTGNISIWSTPWFSTWHSIYDHLVIQDAQFRYPALVKDLWLPNQKAWDNTLIDNLFEQPTTHVIKQTPIIQSEEEDILCWDLTPSGKCTSKSAYKLCLQVMQEHGEATPRQVHPQVKSLLMQVWKNKNMAPRVQTFAWRILRKAIPTGKRVGRFTNHISKICSRCSSMEDDLHLFFLYNFARAAWFSEPWFIRFDTLIQS